MLWSLLASELASVEKGPNLLEGRWRAIDNYDGAGTLAEYHIRDADYSNVSDELHIPDDVLNLDGTQILPTSDDDVLASASDTHPIAVHGRKVARPEPTVLREGCIVVTRIQLPQEHLRTSGLKLTNPVNQVDQPRLRGTDEQPIIGAPPRDRLVR